MRLLNRSFGGWSVLWGVNLLLIPVLSLSGRSLQHWLLELFGREQATLLLTLPLILLALSGVAWLRRQTPRWPLHLIWIGLLFIVLPLALDRFEERMHFLLFGLFGFTSLRLYSTKWALIWVYGMAGGDELLQWWLPTRVGDWHDVYINLVAGMGGLLLAYVGRRRKA